MLAGLAVPAGWCAHDLAILVSSGNAPGPELSTVALLAIAAGGLVGLVARWRSALLAAALAATVGAGLPMLPFVRVNQLDAWALRAAFLQVVGVTIVCWPALRVPVRARLGLALGVGGCLLLGQLRDIRGGVEWPLVSAVLGLLALGFVPRDGLRRAATVVAMSVVVFLYARRVPDVLVHEQSDLAAPTAEPAEDAPNIVLIVLDTVRADHLASYGYQRVTTPQLDDWVAEHCTRFENGRSTSSWTLPSHASLFTGLYPAEHQAVYGGRHARPADDKVETLAELLRARGYRTAGIVANTAYLRAGKYGMERGFEHYDDRPAPDIGDYLVLGQLMGRSLGVGHLHYRDARLITDAALHWIERPLAGPRFLMLNYMDAHTPNVPDNREFSEERPADPLNPPDSMQGLLYDRELFYMDGHLARLLAALEQSEDFARSMIVITSDHGESLGEHGIPHHGWMLYESLVHVPLFVKPPGGRTRLVAHEDTTGADVFHMILAAVGIPPRPAATIPGLMAELHVHPSEPFERRKRFTDRGAGNLIAWREGTRKLIVGSNGEVEAYDLATDPDELSPLVLAPKDAEAALALARQWWESHPIDSGEEVDLTEEDLQRLRALGY